MAIPHMIRIGPAPRPPEATPGSPCIVKVLPLPVWPYLVRPSVGEVPSENLRKHGRHMGKTTGKMGETLEKLGKLDKTWMKHGYKWMRL